MYVCGLCTCVWWCKWYWFMMNAYMHASNHTFIYMHNAHKCRNQRRATPHWDMVKLIILAIWVITCDNVHTTQLSWLQNHHQQVTTSSKQQSVCLCVASQCTCMHVNNVYIYVSMVYVRSTIPPINGYTAFISSIEGGFRISVIHMI